MTYMLHTLTRLLWATALAFILTCCQHGSPSESETQSIRDSLATLRQQGKKERDASRYDEALRLHIRGLDMARAVGDSSEWIQALNNIATDYRRMGMLDVAQSYHYQALTLCDESADTTYQMRKNRVKALNGLGNIYLSIYSYDDADSVFRQALEGEHQLGSATGQAINYANLGSSTVPAAMTRRRLTTTASPCSITRRTAICWAWLSATSTSAISMRDASSTTSRCANTNSQTA